jgi:hypothetical protein
MVAMLSSVLLAPLLTAIPSGAATQDIASTAVYFGVACPSANQCFGVGLNSSGLGAAATPLDPTTGEVSSGEVTRTFPNGDILFGVSCATATVCLGVGGVVNVVGAAVPLDPTTGGAAGGTNALPVSNTEFLEAVGCPSATQCLAIGVDDSGAAVAVSLDPTTGAVTSGQSVHSFATLQFNGVTCSSPTQCLVFGATELGTPTTWPFDPATGLPTALGQSIPGFGNINAVTCPSASECLGVGVAAQNGLGATVPLDPTTGAITSGGSVTDVGGMGDINSVACASASSCLLVGTSLDGTKGETVSIDPQTNVDQPFQFISGFSTIFDIKCATTTLCLGVGSSPDNTQGAVAVLDPTTGAEPATPGPYTPLTPVRICDTRPVSTFAPDNQCSGETVSAGGTRTIDVAGDFGVPANATAVVLNVTVVNPDAPSGGYLTVFPAGDAAPNASNINYVTGEAVPNLVEVGVGSSGMVSFFSSAQTDLIVDLEGYTSPTSLNGAGLYDPLSSPARICDTRAVSDFTSSNQCNGPGEATGTFLAGGTKNIQVTGEGGVPSTAPLPTAVVLNVTVVNPAAAGYVTIYPQGVTEPNASNVNYRAGQTTTNRVIVPLSSSGQITAASSESTDVVVDISGYYTATGGTGSQFTSEPAPVRICDSRSVTSYSPANQCTGHAITSGGTLNADGSGNVVVTGLAGVPSDATAVVINLTGISSTLSTFLTVYPQGTVPNSSDLNPAGRETRANLVVATLSPSGKFVIYNDTGSINVIVDVLGWYS